MQVEYREARYIHFSNIAVPGGTGEGREVIVREDGTVTKWLCSAGQWVSSRSAIAPTSPPAVAIRGMERYIEGTGAHRVLCTNVSFVSAFGRRSFPVALVELLDRGIFVDRYEVPRVRA